MRSVINSNDIHMTLPAITSPLEMEMSEEPQHSHCPCQTEIRLTFKIKNSKYENTSIFQSKYKNCTGHVQIWIIL